jgi:hypothetical protein
MDDATTRDLIRAAAVQIPVRPPDPEQLIAEAGHSRRSSRWVFGAVATVVVVLAATALIGVLVNPDRSSHGDQNPTTRRTTSPTAAPASVAAWVRALPAGAPPRLPYFKGRDFFNGSERVALPGYPYIILGGTPHGFLVQQMRPGYKFRYGIVHGNQSVTWLTAFAFDPLETMSKDHQQLAVADAATIQIVDLANERVTATLRADSPVVGLTSLTDRGVLFGTNQTDGTGQVNLWSPGHPVRELPFEPFAASTDLRYALVHSGGSCADAIHVLPDETTAVDYHGCGNARPLSLSPDGLHAITPDLRTIDLQSGSVDTMTGASAGFAQVSFEDHQIVWEDDTHVLIRLITTGRPDRPGTSALIRCSTDGACERIFTDVPRHPASGYYDVQVLDPTTQPY